VLLPLFVAGCGSDYGGPSVVATPTPAPAATPTPVPTPTPPPNYAGIYVGTMNFTISGVPAGSFNTRLEVTQDGNTIQLGTLTLPGFGDFPLKDATLTSATEFAGSAGYQSVGCGRVKVSTQGNFVGSNDMHLLAGLTSDCVQARLSGDLSR
jgi:hypothetical protein